MQLINRENYETVLNYTKQFNPDGLFINLWLKLQTDKTSPSLFETVLFADIWPNSSILGVVVHHNDESTNIFLWSKNNDEETIFKFLETLDQRMKIKNSEYLLCGISEYNKAAIKKFIGDKHKVKVSYHYQFWIPPDKQKILLQSEILPPNGYYFDKLKLDEAKFVDDRWSHQFPGSLARIQHWIEYMPNIALRVVDSGELAAFELFNDERGLMTHLYTVEQHRRKGLATKVEEKLAQLLISRDIIPFKNVGKLNDMGKAITDISPWWDNLGYYTMYFHVTM